MDDSLLRILSDGDWHSGSDLARLLSVSRTMVWKRIKVIESHGIDIVSSKSEGYKIVGGLDLLDGQRIHGFLLENIAGFEELDFWVDSSVASTNDNVQSVLAVTSCPDRCVIRLAEHQTNGRGRRGRNWVSPFAKNIYLSIGYLESGGIAALDGLSLVIGVALVRALIKQGVSGVGLKWPNDLFVNGHKMGGILVELRGEVAADCDVVIGLGLNVHMQGGVVIDQPWASLAQYMGRRPERTRVASLLLVELLEALQEFKANGVKSFIEQWRKFDILKGKDVALFPGIKRGLAVGLADDGGYQVEIDGVVSVIRAGELSLRGWM